MFTGIVQDLVLVQEVDHGDDLTRLQLDLGEHVEGLQLGASVAVNGTCLTVTRVEQGSAYFDIIAETVRTTTLGRLETGDRVNVERSFSVGDEVGGHIVSGHVTGTAEVVDLSREGTAGNDVVMTFSLAPELARFVFHKGFIAIDGASLTVSSVDKAAGRFQISLIPETLARTTLGQLDVGDHVNVEVDAQTVTTVETVERLFSEMSLERGAD